MNDLNNIRYWLFDLDNTLYDGATKVFDQVDKKMTKFISEKLKVGTEEARKIQKSYFYEYNTTLNGMIKNHKINANLIEDELNKNKIPIIAPLGLDKNNQTFNINGDTAASAIAKKLKSRRLILMTNVEGVYDDKKKLILEIKPFDLDNLIKWKIVEGGMIPKIENCVDAVENGVRGVVILDGRKPHSILHEIFSDTGSGTLIRK